MKSIRTVYTVRGLRLLQFSRDAKPRGPRARVFERNAAGRQRYAVIESQLLGRLHRPRLVQRSMVLPD
jgi:hypothetical protein